MVSAVAVDAGGTNEEGVDFSGGGGVEDQLVSFTVGGVGGVDFADMVWV